MRIQREGAMGKVLPREAKEGRARRGKQQRGKARRKGAEMRGSIRAVRV